VSTQQEDIFSLYFRYIGTNEAPNTFHRWTLISLLGSLVGRSVYIPFGHGQIYPNQYVLLTGSPGARKGSAIKVGKNLISELGYKHTAPNKAVKESFWKWMASKSALEEIDNADNGDAMLDWDIDTDDQITEAYVAHDEFLDFIGIGDDGFITNLANLWDNLPSFTNPKTRGKSITINKPTVNIISGITPEGIANTFKAIALGGGFFSRVLFIYAEQTDVKVTFPDPPNIELELELIEQLTETQNLQGELVLSSEVKEILDTIYKCCPRMEDSRFQYYSQRRFTHLLKLLIIMTTARRSLVAIKEDCILANTILYAAELAMPFALGEYGKGKHAEVANSIIVALNAPGIGALTMKQIWKYVSRDLTKFMDLRDVLDGLVVADKIQKVNQGAKGNMYMAHNAVTSRWPEGLIDFGLLEDDEHKT